MISVSYSQQIMSKKKKFYIRRNVFVCPSMFLIVLSPPRAKRCSNHLEVISCWKVVNFLNFLINDSIFLLDDSLNKILELKELEAEMSNTVEWEQTPAQERQENIIRFDMKLAMEDVSLLAFSTDQVTAPFLLPEMVERVASMLNYFLLQLVSPQRKSLNLKDPEKYEFRPKQLLKQVFVITESIPFYIRE